MTERVYTRIRVLCCMPLVVKRSLYARKEVFCRVLESMRFILNAIECLVP